MIHVARFSRLLTLATCSSVQHPQLICKPKARRAGRACRHWTGVLDRPWPAFPAHSGRCLGAHHSPAAAIGSANAAPDRCAAQPGVWHLVSGRLLVPGSCVFCSVLFCSAHFCPCRLHWSHLTPLPSLPRGDTPPLPHPLPCAVTRCFSRSLVPSFARFPLQRQQATFSPSWSGSAAAPHRTASAVRCTPAE